MKSILVLSFFFAFSEYFSFGQIALFSIYPKEFEQIKTETLVDSMQQLKVILTRETIMDQSVTKIYSNENNSNDTISYRDYSLEIRIEQPDTVLFRKTIRKNDFELILDEKFYQNAIHYNAWFQEYDNKNKTIKITYLLGVPDTDWNCHFTLYVTENGNYHYELDEIE